MNSLPPYGLCHLFIHSKSEVPLKIYAWLAMPLLLGLVACIGQPVHVPDFSTLNFTGSALSAQMSMPLQGVLTNRKGKLKFMVAAAQGVVLGYGTIDPKDCSVGIVFSRSGAVSCLLEKTGEALIELFPMIDGNLASSGGWRNVENLREMVYTSPHLELTAHLENTPQ